jgi:hypothetical protein
MLIYLFYYPIYFVVFPSVFSNVSVPSVTYSEYISLLNLVPSYQAEFNIIAKRTSKARLYFFCSHEI